MDLFEPFRKSSRIVVVISLLVGSTYTSQAQADYFSKEVNNNSQTFFENLLSRSENHWPTLVDRALEIVEKTYNIEHKSFFQGPASDRSFSAYRVVGDPYSTTVKCKQHFQGFEVVNGEFFVHFDSSGKALSQTEKSASGLRSLEKATVTKDEAIQLTSDAYGAVVRTDGQPQLKLVPNREGAYRLAYEVVTKTGATHLGHRLFVDAKNGEILLESPRSYDMAKGEHIATYRADTEEARKADRIDKEDGSPTDLNLEWYVKVIENGNQLEKPDASVQNADRNAHSVYDYYLNTFNRKSFDDKNSPIVSIAHIGVQYDNAFWTDEFQVMGYGDGSAKLTDLTAGLDVAAHEITHAVTSSSSNLMYRGESGALNESYSDFFGKMVDRNSGDWLIGAKVVGPDLHRRALRNMLNPEEFKQPGSNDSPYRKPTTGRCWEGNDFCGVHKNSGIPNKAGALIAEAIGRDKAERLYYNVLTQRLKPLSDFAEARKFTEEACAGMYGADSQECIEVGKAYDAVKM